MKSFFLILCLFQNRILWSDPNLGEKPLTPVKMTVVVFYDDAGGVRLILSPTPGPPTPGPPTPGPPTPPPGPGPTPPVPVPPVPVPVPPSGTFNVSPFIFNLTRPLDSTQRVEFLNNFSSTAATADAGVTKTKAEVQNDLAAKNQSSLQKFPAWRTTLDQIAAEANKHKDEIKTVADLSKLYKEIALGLQ